MLAYLAVHECSSFDSAFIVCCYLTFGNMFCQRINTKHTQKHGRPMMMFAAVIYLRLDETATFPKSTNFEYLNYVLILFASANWDILPKNTLAKSHYYKSRAHSPEIRARKLNKVGLGKRRVNTSSMMLFGAHFRCPTCYKWSVFKFMYRCGGRAQCWRCIH